MDPGNKRRMTVEDGATHSTRVAVRHAHDEGEAARNLNGSAGSNFAAASPA